MFNDTQALTSHQTQQIVENCDFLQLISSSQLYPQSKGSGLPLISVKTALCSAVIAPQGAHLLEYTATEGKPLLWVSPNCDFSPGAALRGGVPVCAPWFGPNPNDPNKPKHGFVRNQTWQLNHATLLKDGSAELTFFFMSKANDLFEFNFSTELTMTLGKSARLELKITNTDAHAFPCSWVLHSYHAINSLRDVRVEGLQGKKYLDNLESHAEKLQAENVSFPSQVDRVFHAIDNSLTILGSPSIAITHHNCPSVVVWNPGENAVNIPDIGVGNEQGYICVERGAVLQEKWNLNAGESKSAWLKFEEKKSS